MLSRFQPLPAWGAWIEIARISMDSEAEMPLPAWGAWIEICWRLDLNPHVPAAAPRMGSVD